MALFDIFGIGSSADYLSGFMSEEERRKLQQRAGQNALLQSGLAMLANSGYSRTPVSLGQILGAGGQAGMQAYQGTLDQGAQNVLMQQKMQEMQRKRQQEALQMQAIEQAAQQYPEYADAIRANPELLKDIVGARFKPDATKVVGNRLVDIKGNVLYEAPADKKSAFGQIDVSKFTPDSVRKFEQSGVYSDLIPIEKTSAESKQRYTGSYGNLALSMFGTTDAESLTPQQRTALDAEARRRNLERPPSISINMPSESERTAGFLTQRLQGGLQQLNEVISQNPKAAAPKIGAEAVKFLTGSDYLKNLANPVDRQRIEAAQLEVLDSALTLGTGAAYTREQLENYRKSYFPQLGDRPETIKDKKKRLETLLESARRKSGRATPPAAGRTVTDIYNQYGAE